MKNKSSQVNASALLTSIFGSLLLAALMISGHRAMAEDWGTPDKLGDFVSRTGDGQPVLTNARAIEAAKLNETSLRVLPWSSTFWPDNAGSVADPYAESHFGIPMYNFVNWNYTKNLIGDRDKLHATLDHVSDDVIANLSPAEKYDLVMGDPNFSFTHAIFARVNQLDDLGLLNLKSLWSGICHGWTPASLYMARPEKLFYATAPNGRRIPFYPSDVKALESMAWGDAFGPGGAQYFAKVSGSRCQHGGKTDANGRFVDESCFDTNPAFLHLTAINQLGLNQRGFIMDRALKDEVQNQPVFAYRFDYYDVANRHADPAKDHLTVDQAKVALSGYSDPFRKYRSPRAVAVVGVEATYWYGNDSGVQPNHNVEDDASHDDHKTYTIRYDLELDASDEIVGGEWREFDGAPTLFEQFSYKHPDLIWLIPPTVEPWSIGDWDVMRDDWNGSGPVPASYLPASLKSDAWYETQTFKGKSVNKMYPQPLLKVVKTLVDMAKK